MSRVERPQMLAGFVLHHRAYRDSSLILDVFTKEAGRLALVARGARRPKSRQRALLQPFRPLRLSWRLGSGDMGSLTDVEPDGTAQNLSGERLLSAFYVNELVLRLAGRHDPLPEVYDLYQRTLEALSALSVDSDAETAIILRRFEKEVLEALGYGLPALDICLDGTPIDADKWYRFDPQAGAYPLGPAQPGEEVTRGISGAALLALASDDWSNKRYLPQLRRLLHNALSPHLGESPLKTAQVLRALRRRKAAGPNQGTESC